jgi:hypothetical protein
MVMSAAAAAVAVVALGAEPVSAADGPCAGCSHDGSRTGSGYSAAAAFVTATGGGSASSDNRCWLEGSEAGMPEEMPRVAGHYELHSYPNGDGTYDVFYDCIEDGHTGIPGNEQFYWDVLEIYEDVPALDPEELVEEALASMRVPTPAVRTSPGDGDPSVAGFETWLMIDRETLQGGSQESAQGPIWVRVWAEPDPAREIVWDTGDGPEVCPRDAADGECTHTYERSSVDQPGRDTEGRPAYEVTASVTYTGGYEVTVFGEPIADESLGDITRTSEPYLLAVEHGEGLNTGG